MKTPLSNWKIYLDTCCLSRLDDVTHARIQQETTAIETILNHCYTEQWLWIGSEILADDRLIRLAKRLGSELTIRVNNPHEWLQEIIKNEHSEND